MDLTPRKREVTEKMKSRWNGTQQAVLNAIKQGVTDRGAIGPWLGMDDTAVTNAVRRLMDKGEIYATSQGHYAAVHNGCLLEQVWR
jgi:hypothetical protein